MINLTSIQVLVDQTTGTLAATLAWPGLPLGAKPGLEACIATLKSISEDIDDYEERVPTQARRFGQATDNLE